MRSNINFRGERIAADLKLFDELALIDNFINEFMLVNFGVNDLAEYLQFRDFSGTHLGSIGRTQRAAKKSQSNFFVGNKFERLTHQDRHSNIFKPDDSGVFSHIAYEKESTMVSRANGKQRFAKPTAARRKR